MAPKHRWCAGMTALAVATLIAGCGPKAEKATVTVSYVLEPSKSLPAGMKSLAVLDAGTGAGTDEIWSQMAANIIQDTVQQSNRRFNLGLTIVDRKQTAQVMKEKDMALAGLVSGAEAAEVAKLHHVQGIICSEVKVREETHTGKRKTIKASSLLTAAMGRGRGIQTEEVEEVSRDLTVQASFKLVDAATAKDWDTHTSPLMRKRDQSRPRFIGGESASTADLTPRDRVIGELVERAVRQFVSRLIPCDVNHPITLESSKNEQCINGVKLLRADDYTGALDAFKGALAEDPEDHRAAFAAGVTSELLKDSDAALGYYRKAVAIKGEPEYADAKNRLANDKDRIRQQ